MEWDFLVTTKKSVRIYKIVHITTLLINSLYMFIFMSLLVPSENENEEICSGL